MLRRVMALALISAAGAASTPRRAAAPRMDAPDGRRVVVTGMGIVSCLGNSIAEVDESLASAKSGLWFNEEFAEIGMRSRVCGLPRGLDFDELIPRKQLRFMGTGTKYTYLAMQQAIEDAGLSDEEVRSMRSAGILGQADCSAADIDETVKAVQARKLRRVGPYRVTRAMGSSVSAVLSTAFGLRGVSYTISSACATGAHCIGQGMEQIQLGKADIAFCGSGECGDWRTAVMFDGMMALSSKYNDEPQRASRAFDVDRDGFVIGGGAVWSSSRSSSALRRAARPFTARWSATARRPTGTTWWRRQASAGSGAWRSRSRWLARSAEIGRWTT